MNIELKEDFQKIINHFFNEIYRQWCIYNEMFSSEKNVDILNHYNNRIIIYFYQLSVNDLIILGIQRLLDETVYNCESRVNLSLHYFKKKLVDNKRKSIGNEIKQLESLFSEYKEYRHKMLGHFDKATNIKLRFGNDMSKIIEKIIKILKLLNKEFDFNLEIPDYGGGIIFEGGRNEREIIKSFIEDIEKLRTFS